MAVGCDNKLSSMILRIEDTQLSIRTNIFRNVEYLDLVTKLLNRPLFIMAPSERSELGAYQTITGSGVQPQGAHGGLIYG